MNDDELRRLFHELPSALQARPGRAAAILASTRRRRAYTALASATAVAILVVGTFAVVGGGGRAAQVGLAAPTTAPGTRSTSAPLPSAVATTVRVSCWNQGQTIALSRITPGVYGTPIAAPLHAFLANPSAFADLELDRLPREQWALLAHDASHRVFAQRTLTGISAVLYFTLSRGSWRPDAQCSIRYGTDTAVAVRQVAVRGRTLDLTWDNGTCNPTRGRPITNLVHTVVVTETTTHVLISVVTYQNPAEIAAEASQAAALPSGTVLGCAGVGLNDHVTITLKAPLGSRTLLDVSSVPPEPIDRNGTIGAPLR